MQKTTKILFNLLVPKTLQGALCEQLEPFPENDDVYRSKNGVNGKANHKGKKINHNLDKEICSITEIDTSF